MPLTEERADAIRENLLSQLDKLPEEQVGSLKEKIKSMNPGELEKFVAQQQTMHQGKTGKKQCLFCQIAKGLIDTIKIYEDDKVLAMLDIMPAKPGQAIIIPKQHYQFLFQLPEDILLHIFNISALLEEIIVNTTKSDGINMHISQGQSAGQNVPHFAINFIPRADNDKLSFDWPRKEADKKALQKIADEMSERMRKDLEIKGKKKEETKISEKQAEKAVKKERGESEMILEHIQKRMP